MLASQVKATGKFPTSPRVKQKHRKPNSVFLTLTVMGQVELEQSRNWTCKIYCGLLHGGCHSSVIIVFSISCLPCYVWIH